MKSIIAIFVLASLAAASPLDIYIHTGSDVVQSGLRTHIKSSEGWHKEENTIDAVFPAQREGKKAIDSQIDPIIVQSDLHAQETCTNWCMPKDPNCSKPWVRTRIYRTIVPHNSFHSRLSCKTATDSCCRSRKSSVKPAGYAVIKTLIGHSTKACIP